MPIVVVASMTAKPESIDTVREVCARSAPAVTALFTDIRDHLERSPDIKMLQPVVAGDPAKGRLWR